MPRICDSVWTFLLNDGFKEVIKFIEVNNMKIMACGGITLQRKAFNMCFSKAKIIILCYDNGQFQKKEVNNFLLVFMLPLICGMKKQTIFKLTNEKLSSEYPLIHVL